MILIQLSPASWSADGNSGRIDWLEKTGFAGARGKNGRDIHDCSSQGNDSRDEIG
jgi:hypothetical protein